MFFTFKAKTILSVYLCVLCGKSLGPTVQKQVFYRAAQNPFCLKGLRRKGPVIAPSAASTEKFPGNLLLLQLATIAESAFSV